MKKMMTASLALVAILAVTGCSDSQNDPMSPDNGLDKARGGNAEVANSIVDVAVAVNADTGEFSTLIAAVLATGLDGPLGIKGQRTVFAPTDAAFAAIGLDAGNIGEVPVDALTEILLYHVANGKRMANDVVRSKQIRMLNGGFAPISTDGDAAFIDGAQIVLPDVMADNGVIHVIDTVLEP